MEREIESEGERDARNAMKEKMREQEKERKRVDYKDKRIFGSFSLWLKYNNSIDYDMDKKYTTINAEEKSIKQRSITTTANTCNCKCIRGINI